MNLNTVAGFIGGTKRNQIPSLTLAAVTETAIPLTTDGGTTPAILAVPQGNAIVGSSTVLGPNGNSAILVPIGGGNVWANNAVNQTPYFNTSSFDSGRPFNLKLIGTGSAVANASNSLTITIYQGTSGTLGSDTSFAVPLSAVATASTATLNFYINVQCFWDSTSQVLSGVYSGSYYYHTGNRTIVANTAATSITSLATPAALSFLASVTWGHAEGGVIAVSEFSIEQI